MFFVGLCLATLGLASLASSTPAGCLSGTCSPGGSVDPCVPSPCGPNTFCSINANGVGVCRCQTGFFPKPDTLTGCGPQCIRNGECPTGYVCRAQKCVTQRTTGFSGTSSSGFHGGGSTGVSQSVFSRNTASATANPCSLVQCGANALCDGVNGRAVCSCPEGYDGNPLSGCNRGECIDDTQCPAGTACVGVRCVDPCARRPCGTGAECRVTNHRAICRCPTGYAGDPFISCVYAPSGTRGGSGGSTFTQFGVGGGRASPRYQGACSPSPCGENTNCVDRAGRAICSCFKNYIGNPLVRCRPECSSDGECSSVQACVQNRCRNPCVQACGENARCESVNHLAICTCPKYYRGTGLTGCYPECTSHAECGTGRACIQLRCADPCAGSCGVGASCRVNGHTPICSCPAGTQGHPYDRCVVVQPDSTTGCTETSGCAGRASSGSLCHPNPCGHLANCAPGFDNTGKTRPVCTCPRGYVGKPLISCQKGECEDHSNCPANQACYNYSCRNPCISEAGTGVCGVNAECRAQGHQGVCFCPPNYTGDPLTQCTRKPLAATDHRAKRFAERFAALTMLHL